MSITATALAIPDVLVLEPEVHTDERGYVYEAWNQADFAAATGYDGQFVQDNHSRSSNGVLRGLHYQLPEPQGKLVRVVVGATFTVAVDIRRRSPTFAKWVAATLSVDNRRQLWIPPGFAHGFLTREEPTDVVYKTTAFYVPSAARAVRWNDPAIGIEWPLAAGAPLLSPRDRNAPLLAEAELFD